MSSDLFKSTATDIYKESKSQLRRDYERRLKQVQNQENFKDHMKKFMKNINKGISFETDIGEDEDKRLAFTESLRQIYKKKRGSQKVVIRAYDFNGKYKWFTLSDKHNMESTIGHISGEMDLATDQSDTNP